MPKLWSDGDEDDPPVFVVCPICRRTYKAFVGAYILHAEKSYHWQAEQELKKGKRVNSETEDRLPEAVHS